MDAKNVFGEPLIPCSLDPKTGYYRDGCCRTDNKDRGAHVVCAILTNKFLEYSKAQGNDLMTPRPEFSFPGLKEGDQWCLCAMRWREAHEAGMAPKVRLQSTEKSALLYVPLDVLLQYAAEEPTAPISQPTN